VSVVYLLAPFYNPDVLTVYLFVLYYFASPYSLFLACLSFVITKAFGEIFAIPSFVIAYLLRYIVGFVPGEFSDYLFIPYCCVFLLLYHYKYGVLLGIFNSVKSGFNTLLYVQFVCWLSFMVNLIYHFYTCFMYLGVMTFQQKASLRNGYFRQIDTS